jgi:hypothetical protein
MPVLVAHGLLGPFDELIYLAIGIVFAIFMIVSWIRSRNEPPEDEDSSGDPTDPEQSPDHFSLQ